MRAKRNIIPKSGILLFLVANLLLVVAWLGLRQGIAFYIIFLLVVLSPLGEQVLRFYYGCTPLTREDQIAKIEPIYHEVIANAHKLNRRISEDIRVYVSNEDRADIYSLGMNSLVVTNAALERPDDELKAMMAHELGHITSHDSAWAMAASVGNVFITALFLFLRCIVRVVCFITNAVHPRGFLSRFFMMLFNALAAGVSGLLDITSDLWKKLMQLLVNWSLREDEFFADLFAFNLGYGTALCRIIDEETGSSDKKSKALLSPYQDPQTRIQHLQEAGCRYRKTY